MTKNRFEARGSRIEVFYFVPRTSFLAPSLATALSQSVEEIYTGTANPMSRVSGQGKIKPPFTPAVAIAPLRVTS
jgi:hypothetical protein